MAGQGRTPKDDRRNRTPLRLGEVRTASANGWQYGAIPTPPEGLSKAAVEAWNTWFAAWFAAFWSPADLPGLRHLVRLYDRVEMGDFTRATELRLSMDGYGVSPKGQQHLRWRAPSPAPEPPPPGRRYGHLRAAPDAATRSEGPHPPRGEVEA